MRFWLVTFATLGVSCATVSALPPSAPVRPPEPARLEVELTVPRTGPIAVHLRVPRRYLPSTPGQAAFSFIRLPRVVPASTVRGLAPTVTVSNQADLQVDYTVDVGALGAYPDANRLAAAFDLPGGRSLPLWALIPSLTGAADSRRLYPIHLEVHSPLPLVSSLEGANGSYRAPLPDDLYSGLLLAGETTEVTCADGLRLVSFDFDRAALQRTAALEAKAATILEAAIGPRRPLKLLAIHRLPKSASGNGIRGLNVGPFAEVLATMLDGEASAADERIVLHELTHSSLPTGGDMPLWISEGFTEYFALELALRLAEWPEETLREAIALSWKAFEGLNPSLRAGASQLSNYPGGLVLAHCIDVRLRKDRSSLAAVLKRARARGEGTMTNDLYEQEIALASAAAGARIVSARRDPLDPASECFLEEGYVKRQPVLAAPTSVLRSLLGITAVDLGDDHTGVGVMEVDATSPFRPDDRIVSVNGVRLVGTDHLRESMSLALPQRSWRFVVIRAGVKQTIEVKAELQLDPASADFWATVAREQWTKGKATR